MNSKSSFKKGINWTLLHQVVNVTINYISLIILAWFLSPTDFGIIALSTVLIGLFEVVNGFGLPQLIIKDQITSRDKIGSFFFSAFSFSLLLALLCFGAGWFYSFFFNSEYSKELFKVISVSCIGILFNSFISIYQSFYHRDLDFKTPIVYNITAITISNVLAIILALQNTSYWALVVRNLFPSIIMSVGFLMFSKYRPAFNMDQGLNPTDKQFTFFLSSNQAVNYLARNMDYIIIGKFFDMGIVGQYSIAYRLMLFPMKMLSSRVQSVLYPTLAKMRGNVSNMLDFYVKVVSYIGFISFPMMGLIGVTSEFWVPFTFNSSYNLLIPLIKILTIVGAFQAVTSPVGSLYLVTDQTRTMFVFSSISSIIMLVGFIIGGLLDNIIIFALIYAILSIIISFFVSNFVPLKLMDYNFTQFLKQTLQSFFPACISYTATWLLLNLASTRTVISNSVNLGLSLFSFSALFVIIYILLFKSEFKNKVFNLKSLLR